MITANDIACKAIEHRIKILQGRRARLDAEIGALEAARAKLVIADEVARA